VTTVLAVDQGTSATKALVVGPGGDVLGEAESVVHPLARDGGGVEQDPEELWQSVVDAGTAAMQAAATPVDAVALSNQGETVLAWDRSTGSPATQALVWQDRRAATVCERLAEHAARLAALTGLELDPYFVAPKIAWLREHVTRDGVATTTDAWLLHRLCGAFVTDAATASRSLLLDLDRVAWAPEATLLFGVEDDELPEIVTCAQPVGSTTTFGPEVPVVGLAVDQQAALFAEACLAAGEAKCTFGTGAFLLATTGSAARRSQSGLVACVAWQLPSPGGRPPVTTYCLDGQVYTVGAALRWLTEVGVITEAADLDAIGGQAAGTGGATFVPGLAGLAAPLIEGIAAQVAWLARAAGDDLGKPLARLRVDGGLTRSRVLMQTQADLLQAPVEVYVSPHATALGVAAFARLGLGAATSAAEAVGTWEPAAVYEPRVSTDEADARLDDWRRAAEATIALLR
jgi:glycerol kinase